MGRLLGIDYGERRIGVAVTDPSGTIAMPREVITVRSSDEALNALTKLCEAVAPERVIVGLPLNMDGSAGPMAQRVEAFAVRLRGAVQMPVETWDERLSTSEVERVLIAADMSRQRRRQVVDKLAAQVMLQSYLSAHATGEEPAEA